MSHFATGEVATESRQAPLGSVCLETKLAQSFLIYRMQATLHIHGPECFAELYVVSRFAAYRTPLLCYRHSRLGLDVNVVMVGRVRRSNVDVPLLSLIARNLFAGLTSLI